MALEVMINGVRYIPAPPVSDNPELLDFVHTFIDRDEAMTIREYLHDLLLTLWIEGESFSGKRPFGNSGWQFGLYEALSKAGVIDWNCGEGGFIPDKVANKANIIISALIIRMCGIIKQ